MTNLKEKLRNIRYTLWRGAKIAFATYLIIQLGSHNGCFDSPRTKEARRYHNPQNPVKVVRRVGERWKDNSTLALVSSAVGGSGYNPRVIRDIEFDDGSKTRLDYRVLAWQPFVRWVNGKEFDPKPGEKYEVDKHNGLVRKMGSGNSRNRILNFL